MNKGTLSGEEDETGTQEEVNLWRKEPKYLLVFPLRAVSLLWDSTTWKSSSQGSSSGADKSNVFFLLPAALKVSVSCSVL